MEQPRGSQSQQRRSLLWVVAVLGALAVITASATVSKNPIDFRSISFGAPIAQPVASVQDQLPAVISSPDLESATTNVAESMQEIPAPAIVVGQPKIHVEWVQIGIARNGGQVVALGIPWDDLIPVSVELVDALPPGVTGIRGGLPTGNGTLILYTYAQTAPWVFTYWRTEIPISQLKSLP